jgi:hypothetical protein
MPLVSPAMQSLIQLKAASKLMAGNKLPDVVSAISGATCQYILLSAIVNSTNIVTGPGAGTQIGRIVGLFPQQMSTAMQLKAGSSLISGRDFGKLCDAISFGVVNAMNSVLLQGTVIGGGPGSGTGKIMGLIPTALTTLILAQEAFRLISGSKLREVISAISFGICTHIMTVGTVTIINIGVASPPPAGTFVLPVAPGIGRLV